MPLPAEIPAALSREGSSDSVPDACSNHYMTASNATAAMADRLDLRAPFRVHSCIGFLGWWGDIDDPVEGETARTFAAPSLSTHPQPGEDTPVTPARALEHLQ